MEFTTPPTLTQDSGTAWSPVSSDGEHVRVIPSGHHQSVLKVDCVQNAPDRIIQRRRLVQRVQSRVDVVTVVDPTR